MSTRGDTYHILNGHVKASNPNNFHATSKVQANAYSYNPQTFAVNKFKSQGNPKLLSQTFAVKPRSVTNPLDSCPVMMLK